MIESTYLEERIRAANQHIANGNYVYVKSYDTHMKRFFPILEEAAGYEYRGYTERISYGPVQTDYKGFYYLPVPPGVQPQAAVNLIEGDFVKNTIVIKLTPALQDRYGALEIVLPVPSHLEEDKILEWLNGSLSNDGMPICVARVRGEYQKPEYLRLATDDVVVPVVGAVLASNTIVAMTIVVTDKQTLTAVRATLATNSKKQLRLYTNKGGYYVENARRGYRVVSQSLDSRNIKGNAVAFVHPLAIKPEEGEPYFWLLTLPGDDIAEKFGRLFPHSTIWPTKPEWSPYLIKKGKNFSLIEEAQVFGQGFGECYQVMDTRIDEQQEDARRTWKYIISHGLKTGEITI